MEKKKVNFVLNEEVLRTNVDNYTEIGQVYYPLKSNSSDVIIEELVKLYEGTNNGFLITHRSHFEKLIRLGIPVDRIGVVNVLADEDDIEYYYNNGVRYFTFDNPESLNKFLEYADPSDVKLSIRLNVKEPFGVESHLGGTTAECKEMFDTLNKHGISNYGISFYLQKELFPEGNVLNKMLDYITKNFDGYKFRFINIGGAIKAHEIDQTKLEETKKLLGADYTIVEPGRYMVGNAGYMEDEIVRKKNEDCIIVRNGIYGGLVDTKLYDKKFQLFLTVEDKFAPITSEKFEGSKSFKLCGSSSDSGDKLGTYYIDEKFYGNLQPGAKIIVLNALTYVEEFFMPLGGDLEAEYHVVNCKTISKKR